MNYNEACNAIGKAVVIYTVREIIDLNIRTPVKLINGTKHFMGISEFEWGALFNTDCTGVYIPTLTGEVYKPNSTYKDGLFGVTIGGALLGSIKVFHLVPTVIKRVYNKDCNDNVKGAK